MERPAWSADGTGSNTGLFGSFSPHPCWSMRWYEGFSVLEKDGPHCSRPGMQGPGLWPLASVQVVVALADQTIASVAMRAAERSSIWNARCTIIRTR